MVRAWLLWNASLAAVVFATLADAPATAQSAQATPASTPVTSATQSSETPDAAGGLAEITVTAQKRETSLQRTPIAIAVLGSDDLANRHALSRATRRW